MVVIEIDGGQHADQLKKDVRRTKYLSERGFSVMRFWNNAVLADTDSVLSVILATLINSPSSPTLLPKGEGSKVTRTQSVFDIRMAENEYFPSPSGRGQGLMFPRFSQMKHVPTQGIEDKKYRKSACRRGMFSALGPTIAEDRQHARARYRTTFYRNPAPRHPCGPPAHARRGGRCAHARQ